MTGEFANTLTRREFEVLQLIVDGRCNKQIANELKISVKTVEIHVSKILQKLQVTSRNTAVTKAIKQGLVELE